MAPRARVDRPTAGADDDHAAQDIGGRDRLERRVGVDLEIGDRCRWMIRLLDTVDDRAALDRHAPARGLDPRMRLDETGPHRENQLDDVATSPHSREPRVVAGWG